MIRIIVSGICGRMGSMVAGLVASITDMSLAGGVEIAGHEDVGRTFDELARDAGGDVAVRGSLNAFEDASFDVLIDFSAPGQAVACAERASRAGKGIVIGTTGLSDTQMDTVRKAATRCAVVVAPNTTLGVNLLFALAGRLARALGDDFDVEIVEAHHRNKKDAPSGTAARLAEIVAAERGLDAAAAVRAGRAGLEAARGPGEIGVHSIRAGGIVGQHSLRFISPLESITLEHEAFSREAFARGALSAARFVVGKAPGLYDMIDVLGLSDDRTPEGDPGQREKSQP